MRVSQKKHDTQQIWKIGNSFKGKIPNTFLNNIILFSKKSYVAYIYVKKFCKIDKKHSLTKRNDIMCEWDLYEEFSLPPVIGNCVNHNFSTAHNK